MNKGFWYGWMALCGIMLVAQLLKQQPSPAMCAMAIGGFVGAVMCLSIDRTNVV